MSIIDHGTWVAYRPAKHPEGAPGNAIFARRESDGLDWYEYCRAEHFKKGSLKLTVRLEDGKPAHLGAGRLMPTCCFLQAIAWSS